MTTAAPDVGRRRELHCCARETFRLVSARPFALSEIAALLLVVGVATGTGTVMALRKD